jgi:hypothetical protein
MKRWTKLDEEKRLCQEWLNEPTINPETGHIIERNGPTFLYWKEKCKELKIKKTGETTMTWRKCQEWKKNPEINPHTGRIIKIGSATFKKLEKACLNITEKEIKLLGEYYIPDTNGYVPCIINNNTKYVIRKYNNRNIWGPLNKPAKGILLYYYTDTWDYKNNHYKPIFIGNKPKKIENKKQYKQNTEIKSLEIKNPKYFVDSFLKLFIN